MPANFSFDRFVLDTGDRRLRAGGDPVELNTRYFDALALLVNEQGRLVAKERFMAEVWAGVPVTDEALTQCIRTLRRQLGDSASRPRFIETVPKHGYRFIAPVRELDGTSPLPAMADGRWRGFIATSVTGTVGGAVAGIIGGLIYGFAGASRPADGGVGAMSVLLVLLAVTLFVAVVGAAGVSLGIAAAHLARPGSWRWSTAAGAGGGLVVGAFGNLLGLDAFTLLVGHSPNGITGAAEG
ncbi:MAG: transcriptional regulator, partial [Sphingomicrobium sp.]